VSRWGVGGGGVVYKLLDELQSHLGPTQGRTGMSKMRD